MRDRDLYARILGIERPWTVSDVKLDEKGKSVEVFLECDEETPACPECKSRCPKYDRRERRWRHLDTCQFQTLIVAQVPRVECKAHGVRQVRVPWAEEGSRFTALMEALIIDWLRETATIASVSRLLGLSWDEVDGVMKRAVERGLERREVRLPARVGIDETSFQKRHEYVTVVSGEDGSVLHVADGRSKEELQKFWRCFSLEERARVEMVAMDMWGPFIEATRSALPDADRKIAFDKFHVAQHLGHAVDLVRREENRTLLVGGDRQLSGTKYLWLKNPKNIAEEAWRDFERLRNGTLKTARAWALKETAMDLWRYRSRMWGERGWWNWNIWAVRSRLEPVKKVARMLKRHLFGILNAMESGVTNARAEGINSVIQWLKHSAHGFRNRNRFRNAIYFHLGGLQLYPATLAR
jgi:transposase